VVKDLPRSDRPSMFSADEDIDKVREMVLKNRCYSLRELVHERNISHVSVHVISVNVSSMRRIAAQLVPKELNFLQKEHHNQLAEDI